MNNSFYGGGSLSLPVSGSRLLSPGVRSGGVNISASADRGKTAQTDKPAVVAQSAKIALAPQELNKLVSEMQLKVAAHSADLQFSVDDESGKTIVKMTDKNTKDVVWQFPSEEALQVTKALDRFQNGLLVNRKA